MLDIMVGRDIERGDTNRITHRIYVCKIHTLYVIQLDEIAMFSTRSNVKYSNYCNYESPQTTHI